MRALIIDDSVKAAVAKVVEYANLHPMHMDELLDIYNGQALPAGDRKEHVIVIPMGYRTVFSIEHQQGHLLKHMSISVDTPSKLPNEIAVREIMKLFEITSPLEECDVRIEEGPLRSINIMALT